jgi:hypothetical protein
VLAFTLAMTVWLGPRHLATELIGVAGLALAAPAALIAGTGEVAALAWIVWGLCAAHNVISVLYVRLRIDQRHGRASATQGVVVVAAHVGSLILTVVGAAVGRLPLLVALPIAALLGRAFVVAWRNPPLENVKHFGFTEMGLALLFAALVVAAFLIAR